MNRIIGNTNLRVHTVYHNVARMSTKKFSLRFFYRTFAPHFSLDRHRHGDPLLTPCYSMIACCTKNRSMKWFLFAVVAAVLFQLYKV